MTGDDFSRLLQAHRSIREFEVRPLDRSLIDRSLIDRSLIDRSLIDRSLIDRVLVDALHGSSSSGNLNMVSVIKTFDVERKQRRCELHFDQPMVLQAPLVLTCCADSHRTRQWLAQRGARLGFGDFISWPIAQFDRRRLDDRLQSTSATGPQKCRRRERVVPGHWPSCTPARAHSNQCPPKRHGLAAVLLPLPRGPRPPLVW